VKEHISGVGNFRAFFWLVRGPLGHSLGHSWNARMALTSQLTFLLFLTWGSAVLYLLGVIVCCMFIDYDYGNQSYLLYYCPLAGVSTVDHKYSNTVCTILTWSNAPDAPYPLMLSMALPTNHKLPYLWMTSSCRSSTTTSVEHWIWSPRFTNFLFANLWHD
jgi:hypothetical protein